MNYQNLTQKNINELAEKKEITAISIKRFKNKAWIWCWYHDKMIGVSRTMTEESAEKFYDKMKEKYGV